MEIKKDSLCFAEYYFPNDETRKKEVSLFFINSASYYGPFKGWSIYIHALKQDLVSALSDERQQLDKVIYHFGSEITEHTIESTIYLGKVLSFNNIIEKMPFEDRIELENKELITLQEAIRVWDFVNENLRQLGFVEYKSDNEPNFVRTIDGRPVPLSY